MKGRPIPNFHALTNSYPGIVNRIITRASMSIAFDPKNPPENPLRYETDALWDTGATSSVITSDVVKALGLVPIGKSVTNHGGGQSAALRYIVNLFLPNGVAFPGVPVIELPEVVDNFGIIIGMDVIASGDFSITSFKGKTCFSFRIPSQGNVDFVKDFNTQLRNAFGPNDPCPCNSGVKFKKCHGAKA